MVGHNDQNPTDKKLLISRIEYKLIISRKNVSYELDYITFYRKHDSGHKA